MSEVPLYSRLTPTSSGGAPPSDPSVQGHLADQKYPPPEDHHRALGIVLLQGPQRVGFLMSEVPLSACLSLKWRLGSHAPTVGS